jgi:hypothetical protein
VLEDYHTVESKQVHSLVERLVRTMPASMRLLVLSRVDPPWPLGHWRAQGWLGEVRSRDLRFSIAEARRFFAGERGAVQVWAGPSLVEFGGRVQFKIDDGTVVESPFYNRFFVDNASGRPKIVKGYALVDLSMLPVKYTNQLYKLARPA